MAMGREARLMGTGAPVAVTVEPVPWLLAAVLTLCTACGGGDGPDYDESAPISSPHGSSLTLPPAGSLYHGVFPGHDIGLDGIEGNEDDLTPPDVDTYEAAVGREAAWVYFSHNWYAGAAFPLETATWIRSRGAVPFIRIMLRHTEESGDRVPRDPYTLEAILDGDFDAELDAWGHAAADFGTPIIVEWGTEMNGEWFWWNGQHNGADASGPELFVNAYRHIVRVVCDAGASNTIWAFHIAAEGVPEDPWNDFENYYPGDDAVDWLGVSAYGAEHPSDQVSSLAALLDDAVPRLQSVAPGKPIFVLELGVATATDAASAAWVDTALTQLRGDRWPNIKGLAWWNENWENDDGAQTTMRLQDLPQTAAVVNGHLSGADIVSVPIVP